MALQNDLLLRAAKGEKTERVPVWLMRQAGRVLREYREVRDSVSGFIELATTPALAAEVTLQPVDILGVDAAIIFSDILVIPEAMGLPYQMIERRGPWFENTICSAADLKKVRVANPEESLHYVAEAIKISKTKLKQRVPLIGFAGAPWTIFSYMVQGSGSKTFSKAKQMLYTEPALSHRLLNMITQSTIKYLKMQIRSGVDLVQIFDSWAGILSPAHYEEFGLKYIAEICQEIQEVPMTVFAKGAFFASESLGKLNCETIGLDWNMEAATSRQRIGQHKTLQGNMDPCALYGSEESIVQHTTQMLEAFGGHRHIANLGHGLYPDIHPDKVKIFVETVKNWRANATPTH